MHANSRLMGSITIAGGLLLAAMYYGSAHAADPSLNAIITSAARNGHATEGFAYNQAVVAVPVRGGQCPHVGVVYPRDSSRHRRGPRIDNFEVCAGQEPEDLQEVSPALPDDQQFKQLTVMTIRGAIRYGEQHSAWMGYNVHSRRLSFADPNGCAQVETTVDNEGLLVSYNVGRMCP